MSSDLWTEASYDAEAEARARNLEMAKHASSGHWAFLAQAQSEQEYADRVALASDTITTVATTYDVPLETLLNVFDQRFALLMESSDNPFAKDSQDDDGDDSSDSKDDDSSDDSDSGDDDSNGDGNDDNSDSDEDSDDTGDGDDEDDSDSSDPSDSDNGKNGDDSGGAPPWANKFSALASRIAAGEDPLTWSAAAPFVPSPARKHAADGADPTAGQGDASTQIGDPTADTPEQQPDDTQAPDAQGPDVPPDPGGTPDPTDVPGLNGGIASTTKPRQMPEGGGMNGGMGDDGITGEFDPDMNGGDIQQGADSMPDTAEGPEATDKIAAIAYEVRRYNPHLSNFQCAAIAHNVYDAYLRKHAEDVNPLLYGDRGAIGDGPISGPLKNWSPQDIKPKLPGQSAPGGGTTPKLPELPPGGGAAGELGAGTGGAAGELAAGSGGAAELLPLLAL